MATDYHYSCVGLGIVHKVAALMSMCAENPEACGSVHLSFSLSRYIYLLNILYSVMLLKNIFYCTKQYHFKFKINSILHNAGETKLHKRKSTDIYTFSRFTITKLVLDEHKWAYVI